MVSPKVYAVSHGNLYLSNGLKCPKQLCCSFQHETIYKCPLVVNAVLIVDVQQFVFDPADLLGRLLPGLVMQTVFLIKLSQAHHGLLTHTPL